MSRTNHLFTLPLLLTMALLVQSCALINFVPGSEPGQANVPPSVSVGSVELAYHPNAMQLAAYFCAEYVPPPANVFVCPAAFGQVSMSELEFAFDLQLRFSNPNAIPLPVVEALVAFTAYPQTSEQHLGALCITMCESPQACPQNQPGACQSDEPEITDMQSLTGAAVGFLSRVATGQASFEDLRLRTIEPSSELVLQTRLSLSPAQLLPLIKETMTTLIDTLRNRQVPSFSIPYRLEGSVWVTIENLGRVAVEFGPVEQTWNILPERN